MESEFIALDKATEEAEWLRQFVENIPRWSKPMPAICVYCDNQSAIGRSRYFPVVYARAATEKSIHDFTVKDVDGKEVSLSKFKGKVLLIVNVASKCGLTSSNYTELSHLYEKYKTQGFEILAFPCNQFGGQEPGSNPEIKQFACTRFKAEFPIFDKVDVNGPSTAPVYQFLKSSAGGILGDLIKWNFEKFLVDKNGKVVQRYPPTTSPFQIEKDIQSLVAA
ncbi:putative glutathione peroxidase 7, chloroplastic [Olea europaea var. sylvestris]|uniref:putative glutathione peroxidase 7, chloroplastic n=1 Tax=Olea europaea var. sylvestris TaxID=158386 RepID=UPI000C1D7ABD|nr:putative glutathione peroxidase 7, chloroplastic [Olea europaea var. sylvestris]